MQPRWSPRRGNYLFFVATSVAYDAPNLHRLARNHMLGLMEVADQVQCPAQVIRCRSSVAPEEDGITAIILFSWVTASTGAGAGSGVPSGVNTMSL
jgi:hypothetical protein